MHEIDLSESSRQGWANLFEAIPDAMLITRYVDGCILKANFACINVFGYSLDEMIGRTTVELGIFKDVADREALIAQFVDADFFMEVMYFHRDAHPRFGLFSGKRILVNGEKALLIIARDITDRKQIETSLEEANARFDQLAEVTRIVPWETSAEQLITYIGPAIELLGFAADDALNLPLLQIFDFEKKDRARVQLGLQSLLAGSIDRYVDRCSIFYQGQRKDFEIRATAEHDAFNVVTGLMGTLQDVSHFAHTERELRELALTDAVTSLYNRRGFYLKLDASMNSRRISDKNLLVLFIDLDGFKDINDQYGHAVGDELLCAVADSLRLALRDTDVIARLGGDEFVALLTNTAPEFSKTVCQSILAALDDIELEGVAQKGVKASVGLVAAGNESVDDVMQRADSAMYRAKQSGKNQFIIDI